MRLVAVSLLLLSLGCWTEMPEEPTLESRQDVTAGVDGTVEFLNLEGGCWAIKVADVHYQPLNLADEFKQDGLRVRVSMQRRDDVASFCMIGPIVSVLTIRRR